MEFLGHHLSQSSIAPLPGKFDEIQNIIQSSTLRNILVLFNMVCYYRQFIPHFTKSSEPLVRLLMKAAPFTWDEEHYSA